MRWQASGPRTLFLGSTQRYACGERALQHDTGYDSRAEQHPHGGEHGVEMAGDGMPFALRRSDQPVDRARNKKLDTVGAGSLPS